MKRERKSRTWQLITVCMVVFLAAFSLPIHASALPDNEDSPNPEYDDTSQWSTGERTLWNWMHNDFKTPMWSEFAELESLISSSSESLVTAAENANSNQSTLQNIDTIVSSIDVAKDLNDFYNTKTKAGQDEDMLSLVDTTNTRVSAANTLWQMVGNVLGNGGNMSILDKEKNGKAPEIKLGVDVNDVTSKYNVFLNGFMKTLAYSLVLIFFSVGLIESTIKYEIVTIKGAVAFGGRLLLAKIIIDCSTTVCVKIVGITEWICTNLASAGSAVPKLLALEAKKPKSSSLWVIGKIVDFFNSLTAITPILLITLTIIVISIAILIKLLIRNIQLCIFTITAPPFFATLASDTTKRYFHNYISAFLQCALQVAFMCIVWYVGVMLLNSHGISNDSLTDLATDTSLWRALIIYICMGILICKPPKFLSNALS